jgi:hypothetical protein
MQTQGAQLFARQGDSKTVQLPAVAQPLTVCGITGLSANNNRCAPTPAPDHPPQNYGLRLIKRRKPKKASKGKSADKEVKVKPCGFLKKISTPRFARVVFFYKKP